MVDTPSVLVVRDGSTPPLTRNVGGTADGSGSFYPEHSLRSDGTPVGAAAPLPVLQGGSTGTDYSANAASVPISGYTLLATIPATPTRAYMEVQNQSAGTVQLVRDNGSGLNQTTILLASGGSSGTQGAAWGSATFKGRVQVFGAAGSQVAAYQE